MIFITLGTYPLPFKRLIESLDVLFGKGLIKDEVFAQLGYTDYIPKYIPYTKLLGKDEFDNTIKNASALIGHAGIGSITLALEYKKPLLVMPRLKKFHEHVNNHQLDTALKFESLGHVLVAYNEDELADKIMSLKNFVPKPRITQGDAVAQRINDFLRTGK